MRRNVVSFVRRRPVLDSEVKPFPARHRRMPRLRVVAPDKVGRHVGEKRLRALCAHGSPLPAEMIAYGASDSGTPDRRDEMERGCLTIPKQ
jgi:hypothetical protein